MVTERKTPQQREGERILKELRRHVVNTLKTIPESPDGVRAATIEKEAGLSLGLERFDGYLAYSLVQKMAEDGELVPVERKGHRRTYVLPSSRSRVSRRRRAA